MAEPLRIVVTGCTRGLGRALVERFVELGHQVAGCGRSASHVEALRRQFAKPHYFAVVNVADDQAVAAWAKTVLTEFGVPDFLLNNAALMNRQAPLWQLSAREFDELMAVNVLGVANVCRHFVPSMIRRDRGVIVNFSSGWGRSVAANVAPYCASKFAVEGLTKALAAELPTGMAAVPLNPGIIDTDMLRQAWADDAAQFPGAKDWSNKAAAFILALGPNDSGHSRSVS